MTIRKAAANDIDAIETIYNDTITLEEQGLLTTGWIRGVYPVRAVAEAALSRDDLFVMEDNGEIVGTAIINHIQMDAYADGTWEYDAPDDKIMVLHTLIISPKHTGHGYGKAFVAFYEDYALQHGCPYLRMDTNARNVNARKLYKKLGFTEPDIVPCDFNGIKSVHMVLLEKFIG